MHRSRKQRDVSFLGPHTQRRNLLLVLKSRLRLVLNHALIKPASFRRFFIVTQGRKSLKTAQNLTLAIKPYKKSVDVVSSVDLHTQRRNLLLVLKCRLRLVLTHVLIKPTTFRRFWVDTQGRKSLKTA